MSKKKEETEEKDIVKAIAKPLNIYQKIVLAKKDVKKSKVKRAGRNKYSEYDYFTPDQVESIVFDACSNQGLLTMFELLRVDVRENDKEYTGRLRIVDTVSEKSIILEMATDIPNIKATNIAQQIGGAMTYTERYMKMTAFGIAENSLDFDDGDNTKSSSGNKKSKAKPKGSGGQTSPQTTTQPYVSSGVPPAKKKTEIEAKVEPEKKTEPATEIPAVLPDEVVDKAKGLADKIKGKVTNVEGFASDGQLDEIAKLIKSEFLSDAYKKKGSDFLKLDDSDKFEGKAKGIIDFFNSKIKMAEVLGTKK